MLHSQAYNRVKQNLAQSRVSQFGCYYVVSIKRGRQRIASSPQMSVDKAAEEFEFRYNLVTF